MESHKNSFCSNTNGVIDADITEAEADDDNDDDDDDGGDFLLSVLVIDNRDGFVFIPCR